MPCSPGRAPAEARQAPRIGLPKLGRPRERYGARACGRWSSRRATAAPGRHEAVHRGSSAAHTSVMMLVDAPKQIRDLRDGFPLDVARGGQRLPPGVLETT